MYKKIKQETPMERIKRVKDTHKIAKEEKIIASKNCIFVSLRIKWASY